MMYIQDEGGDTGDEEGCSTMKLWQNGDSSTQNETETRNILYLILNLKG